MLRHHMLLMLLILKALVINAAGDKCGNSISFLFFPAFFPVDLPRELFAKQTSLGILIIMRYPFTIRRLLQMIGYYASLC